jgi:hypothetical protein
MAKYHQKRKSEDTFLKDSTAGEARSVLLIGLVVGLLAAAGMFWATHKTSLDTMRAFNISLLVASTIGFIFYARRAVQSGLAITLLNLLIFINFIDIDSLSDFPHVALLFAPTIAVVSLLLHEILRIRSTLLVTLLVAPLVILAHLAG